MRIDILSQTTTITNEVSLIDNNYKIEFLLHLNQAKELGPKFNLALLGGRELRRTH